MSHSSTSPDGPKEAEKPETHRAVVLGVVIAGILVSFAAAGPYSFASLLIGVVLLSVLVAYGGGLPSSSSLDALGYAAALAFTLVLILGLPLDFVSSNGFSGWHDNDRVSSVQPTRTDGLWAFVAWAVLFCVLFAWLRWRVWRATDPDQKKPYGWRELRKRQTWREAGSALRQWAQHDRSRGSSAKPGHAGTQDLGTTSEGHGAPPNA